MDKDSYGQISEYFGIPSVVQLITNRHDRFLNIHRVRKKGATWFFAITLPNPNRSSKFFYRHTQQ